MQCSVAEPVGFRSAVAPAPGVKVAFFIFILFETSQKQALNKGELVQPGLVQYCKGREKMFLFEDCYSKFEVTLFGSSQKRILSRWSRFQISASAPIN